ncbi:hypothetical protein KC19_1G095600 [Ceratodon purpureus]|uniref:Uncharacterized protein n=1 Tax=Ceratodon purpureus TaxID=3225 RepID=A0A8T0J455_CERPU|nr:hypothetical protein KC19_1G095600 [Ceratodon purpureus]
MGTLRVWSGRWFYSWDHSFYSSIGLQSSISAHLLKERIPAISLGSLKLRADIEGASTKELQNKGSRDLKTNYRGLLTLSNYTSVAMLNITLLLLLSRTKCPATSTCFYQEMLKTIFR